MTPCTRSAASWGFIEGKGTPRTSDWPVDTFTREPVYVPETKAADDLLREMQTDHVHMALAVDEYGGIAGLVTMEDLLEEVVGELTDEHDPAEYVQQKPLRKELEIYYLFPVSSDIIADFFDIPPDQAELRGQLKQYLQVVLDSRIGPGTATHSDRR